MSDVVSLGLKKIYVAPVASWENETFPANNSSATSGTWVDLGDVYMDSCTLTDEDAEKTIHKSETSKRRIVVAKPGDCKMALQLMDPNLETLARYFGGSISTTGSGASAKKTWVRPTKFQPKAFAIWVNPSDGDALKCPLAAITPKFNITYNETGIMLVDLDIDLLGEVTLTENYDATYGPMYHAS